MFGWWYAIVRWPGNVTPVSQPLKVRPIDGGGGERLEGYAVPHYRLLGRSAEDKR